jgi:exoribonuclease R
MLPKKLFTDLTSLTYHEDRPAMIIEMVIGDGGVMQSSNIYRARVRNQAKEIIEDFMIAANGMIARFLDGKKVASLRRMGPDLSAADRKPAALRG